MRELPREVKEMQGTYEPSKEGVSPVEYDKYERVPTPPDGYPPHVQKIWTERCYDLKNSGYLVKAFMPTLKLYCDWFTIYFDALTRVQNDGFIITKQGSQGQSYDVPNPALQVMDNAMKWITKINEKYGFTPLDVQKIPVIKKDETKTMSLLK